MNQEVEKYLQEVSRGLFHMSKEEKEEIILEIRSHIHTATEKSESANQVLARLGSSVTLAKAYSFDYAVQHQKLKPLDILSNFSFYGLAGLSGIIVVPTLCILAFTFFMIALVIPGTAITNLAGITNVPMFVLWGEYSVPAGILQLVLGIAIGAIFILLIWFCWCGLRKYIKTVSKKYRNFKLRK